MALTGREQEWADCLQCAEEHEQLAEWLTDYRRQRMTNKELLKELENCRNELCLKCGAYRESHLGACDDCRYNFEHMKKWEAEDEQV
jgi:hypothetical protein